tara:strand:- start:982 stop:1215 length:234 start_codon:yes stop_codon:yes gene_type:complete
MNSLIDYAKSDKEAKIKTGYTAWREKKDNQKAWDEAVEGYKSGLSPSTVARWLQNEKGCPLTDNTIRNQLKDAVNGG